MYRRRFISDELYRKLYDYLFEVIHKAVGDALQHQAEQSELDSTGQVIPGKAPPKSVPDRRVIEQRIEEDRERHKIHRETAWAVTEEDEAAMLWTESTEFTDEDYRLMREQAEERYLATASCPSHGSVNLKAYNLVRKQGEAAGQLYYDNGVDGPRVAIPIDRPRTPSAAGTFINGLMRGTVPDEPMAVPERKPTAKPEPGPDVVLFTGTDATMHANAHAQAPVDDVDRMADVLFSTDAANAPTAA